MSNLNSTKALIHRILFYKYALVVALIVIVSLITWHFFATQITSKDIVINFATPVITAFLISLFYDLFTKKEDAIRANEERELLLSRFANDIFGAVDLGQISVDQKEGLVRRLVGNRETMEIIAKEISGPVGDKALAIHLVNLSKGNFLCDVDVINTLDISNTSESSYSLDFLQRFTVPRDDKLEFFVLFSSDNELFNNLVASPLIIDAMVGVSESDWGGLDSLLCNLKMRSSRIIEGHRETTEIPFAELSAPQLQQRLEAGAALSDKVRGFIFRFPGTPSSYHFVFSYKAWNNLRDPYYYWFAETPMFVKSITIDYSGLRKRVGRVSANCFIGNYTCDPAHDQTQGVYRIDVDGLLWPGQGALVVWRLPASSHDVV